MPLLADRVLETSTTSGTGTLTLAGAITGYRTFNASFANADIVFYTIDDGVGNWEIGSGAVGTGTLARTTVIESSNANALVVFSSASKRVFNTAPVPVLLPDQTGNNTKVLTTNGTIPSWTIPAASGVSSVSGTAPVVSSGGTTPAISMAAATTSVPGYLTAADWTIFNGKGSVTSVGSTGTVNGITLTGTVTTSGSITLGGTLSGVSLTTQVSGTLPVANGGTNLTAVGTSGNVLTSNGTTWQSTAPAASGITTGKAIAMALIFGM